MKAVICGEPLEERQQQAQPSHLAQYSSECRDKRERSSKPKYVWRAEYDAHLKAHYFGGLNRRFQVLNRMVRLTGLPRWYIKRQAARLGLTLHMDRTPWTAREMNLLEKLVGHVSSATIAKRLHRPESSVVNKLKRIGTSRRVRNGYTMRDLELCFGEDHHKITQWIKNGWLQDRLQGTRRHDGNGNDIHRIREKDILTFIRYHPQEINLGKVDQTWFLDLVLLRGREVPAAKLPRKRDTAEDEAEA
jgi:DNA-binding CsgD family transcriptional regulator